MWEKSELEALEAHVHMLTIKSVGQDLSDPEKMLLWRLTEFIDILRFYIKNSN